MFNNVVLDVAIGLIFIYLLYSLLATTINEFVAMIFAYRHRMLEKGIEQMLGGKNYSYYWWDKVVNLVRWWVSRKNDELLLPGILPAPDSPISPDSPPSEMQVKSISDKPSGTMDKIKKNIIPPKEFWTNETTNENQPFGIEKNTGDIKRVKLDNKALLFASRVTNHPLYRRKSEHSILFKKPAYLETTAFSDILIDILSGRKSTINSSPVLMNDIRWFVNNEFENNPDLKSILNLYIEQANGDVQKFKFLLEIWYDDTMDRVSGWYKRQATKILFAIGLILSVIFNVNSIEIVNKLSTDKPARQAMVQNASEYVKNYYAKEGEAPTILNQDSSKKTAAKNKTSKIDADSGKSRNNKNNTVINLPALAADSNKKITGSDSSFDQAKKKLAQINKLYSESIEQNNTILGLGWDDYGYSKDSLQQKEDLKKYLDDSSAYAALEKYILSKNSIIQKNDSLRYFKDSSAYSDNIIGNKNYKGKKPLLTTYLNSKDSVQRQNDLLQYSKDSTALVDSLAESKNYKKNEEKPLLPMYMKPGNWYKVRYILVQTFGKPHNWIGFIITALALSLGAPFWFDLLNKFVNIRAGGNDPSEKKGKAPAAKTVMLNQKS